MVEDIVLINPTKFELLSRGVLPIGNVELGYLSAMLKRYGYTNRLIDPAVDGCMIEDVPKYLHPVKGWRIIIIYTVYSCMNLVRRITQVIRTQSDDANFIVLFGQAASLSPIDVFKKGYSADVIIIGEGEQTVVELTDALNYGTDWRTIPGLAYLSNNDIVFSPKRVAIKDLDSLPFPTRDNLDKYQRFSKVMQITSSRGCYGGCSFCPRKAFRKLSGGSPWRPRSPENVVDEIEYLVGELGIEYLEFNDEDFLGHRDTGYIRACAIANEILRRNLKVHYEIHTRVDNVERDIFELLVRSGLFRVQIGLESGNDASLTIYNKHTTVEQNYAAIHILQDLKIDIDAGFIMFDPYITPSAIRQNIEFLEVTGLLHYLRPHRLMAVPGTPIHRRLVKEGLLLMDQFVTADLVPDYIFVNRLSEEIYRAWTDWLLQVDETFNGLGELLLAVPLLKLYEIAAGFSQYELDRLLELNHEFKRIEAAFVKEATHQVDTALIRDNWKLYWASCEHKLQAIHKQIDTFLESSSTLRDYLVV